MNARERVICAARRQAPDRVPCMMTFEHGLARQLQALLETNDLERYFGVDLLGVSVQPSLQIGDYSRYFSRSGIVWDEWGCGRIWDASQHYAEYLYPLEMMDSVDDLEAYPWPDLTQPYRFEGLKARVDALHADGYAVCGWQGSIGFEIAWQLRSMDRLFEDMLNDNVFAERLFQQIHLRALAVAQGFVDAGVDILLLGDDVAMQTGLLMSRALFARWLQPGLAEVIRTAKAINPDVLVWFHSDGKIDALIPELIDAGIDILNPVQPECVDHAWVKRCYGHRLAFSGGLGVQSVLPFGTPAEVRRHVRETFETLGNGGGLIIGPSHCLERDVPLDNILAMAEEIHACQY